MLTAIKSVYKNYANFKGRARRSEFWLFYLAYSLINTVLFSLGFLVDNETVGGLCFIVAFVFTLGSIIPFLALVCRRLHDTGKPGAYIFCSLIPVVGSILLLIWYFQDGEPWTNQYGPDPKGRNYGSEANDSNQVQSPVAQVQQYETPTIQPEQETMSVQTVAPISRTAPMEPELVCVCEQGTIAGTSSKGRVVVIGRDPRVCDMVFPGNAPGISAKHCSVKSEGNRAIIMDLGSSYGTYLSNGQKLPPNTPVSINYGDFFYLATNQTVISVRQSR